MQPTHPPDSPSSVDPLHADHVPRPNRKWRWISLAIALALLIVFFLNLNRVRSRADRLESASNLRKIGEAAILYASNSQEQFPSTFADLLLAEHLSSAIFIASNSHDTPATGPTPRDIATNLSTPGHCSYVYLGKGLNLRIATLSIVLAYEPPNINNNQGGNVLFSDGHVQFLAMPAINSILTQIKSGDWPVHYPPLPAPAPKR